MEHDKSGSRKTQIECKTKSVRNMPDFINISSKEEVYKRLKSLEPLSVVSHHDADGVYSAVILSKLFEIDRIEFPTTFGDYGGEFNVSLDFGAPIDDPEWDGIAIDHHPHNMTDKKYALVHSHVPTGLILWDMFKDRLDPKWAWLVAGSLVGDGQPALIPPEIFELHPTLLEMRGSVYYSYGKYSFYEYSLYSLLSSPINAGCRAHKPYQTYLILKVAQEPDNVINHPVLRADQNVLTMEVNNIIDKFGKNKKERNNTLYIGNFVVMPISSRYRIASRLATALGVNLKGKTMIVLNRETEAISIRGDLAYWLLGKMAPLGWAMGGHAGYCGGNLGVQEGETADEKILQFLKDLRSVVYG